MSCVPFEKDVDVGNPGPGRSGQKIDVTIVAWRPDAKKGPAPRGGLFSRRPGVRYFVSNLHTGLDVVPNERHIDVTHVAVVVRNLVELPVRAGDDRQP